jgi:signal peptidase I
MTGFVARAAARLLDLALPGAGTLLAGRLAVGALAALAWTACEASIAAAVGFGGLDPIRAVPVAAVTHLGLGVLLSLTPLPVPLRLRPGTAAAGVACIAAVVALAAWRAPLSLVALTGFGEFPGLLPGEVLLVRHHDFVAEPPGRGELVVARVDGRTSVARVAGLADDVVGLAGASLTINEAVVPSTLQGEVKVAEGPWPAEETMSLQAYEEELDGRRHLFFFRRDVALLPEAHKVPAGSVFLLADNRSTGEPADSRDLGPVPVSALVGRPDKVLWSPLPGGGLRTERIGAVWP